jgi:hypothetical protein
MESDFKEYVLKLRDQVALHIVELCGTTSMMKTAMKILLDAPIPTDTIKSVIETLILNEVEPIRVNTDLIDVLIKLKASSTSDVVIADVCRLWGDTAFNKAIITCVSNGRLDLIKDVISSGLSYEKVLLLRVLQ